ncbi:unnamed protein product [Blepharisma stoltei]|uniref:Uncharacterized protein n=1 Tax=Blepharisma stoltei TaxID=1481888 RepID=A0AAU9J6M4_9CILI|nr:unnamed protein product [Blepharisma stoltei]
MGTRKLAGKLLLAAILLVLGSRMLTNPEHYTTEWKAGLNHYFSHTSFYPDATTAVRLYGGSILLSTILLLLKFEEVSCILLFLLSLSTWSIYNPFYASEEWIFQMSLSNIGLISALLILMEETWGKIDAMIRRLRLRILNK